MEPVGEGPKHHSISLNRRHAIPAAFPPRDMAFPRDGGSGGVGEAVTGLQPSGLQSTQEPSPEIWPQRLDPPAVTLVPLVPMFIDVSDV